jgi:hypothetical protein
MLSESLSCGSMPVPFLIFPSLIPLAHTPQGFWQTQLGGKGKVL